MCYDTWLMMLGFAGQGLFMSRFLVQWFYSEKHKKSVIPRSFWYLSLVGGVLLFTYALLRKDPVIMLGQFFGIFIYIRNIYFIRRADIKL